MRPCAASVIPKRNGQVKQSGERHALIPGSYRVEGWRGDYDEITFEVAAGDEREIVLRNQE